LPPVLIDGDARCVIQLEGEIDISSAGELKGMMVAAIASGKELQLDLQATTELDVTAVQLMWCAAREAEKTGASFRVVNLPQSIRSSICEMGFDDFSAPPTSADAHDR
jgi:anti-anti-sigma factor